MEYTPLKQLRVEKGLSRAELSRKSGVSTAQICNIEIGKTKPGAVTIKKLAEALDVDYDKLYNLYF